MLNLSAEELEERLMALILRPAALIKPIYKLISVSDFEIF